MRIDRRLPLAVLATTLLLHFGLLPATAQEMEKASPEGPYLGGQACLECHEGSELNLDNVHARIEPFEVREHAVGCEGCHGPGSLHAEEGEAGLIRSFADDGYAASEACMECHQTKGLTEWHASTHAAEEVACTDCHSVHEASQPQDACIGCHTEQVARFRLPSHHPVREGKMSCASCHDVHAATEAQLKSRLRTNDLCFTCHQAKEGPFVFEHAPVQEECGICHEPHGSVANNLLTANEPMLCLQCHDLHFHAGYRSSDSSVVEVGGFERENPFGASGFNMAFTTSCTQCHSKIHGSDLPSQTVPGQGKGLLR